MADAIVSRRFSGDAAGRGWSLYTVEAPNNVVALDAATGRVIWRFTYTPAPTARVAGGAANRGLAILRDTLFLGTLDAHLLAIDAYTGKLRWDVTVANATDPACQLGRCYGMTHAPLVVKDKVVVGVAGGDDVTPGRGIRGFIAAFDATTGKEVWRFNTIPAAGEPGSETWSGDSWKTGGGGIWVTGSYDPDLNLTYWGTGNPEPPRDGSSRPGDNLYSNCVVALDPDTGQLKWYYQFTPHDDMDWDSAQVPVLAEMQWEGRSRKAMLWANRNGLMYVLDRTTGQVLSGKPFVAVNWTSGLDSRGRPVRVPGKVSGAKTLILPGDATNFYPPSYSPSTEAVLHSRLGARQPGRDEASPEPRIRGSTGDRSADWHASMGVQKGRCDIHGWSPDHRIRPLVHWRSRRSVFGT